MTSTMELRLEIYTAEGWVPAIAVDNFTREVIKNFIDKRLFEDEVNPGLQNETNTCISLLSSTVDTVEFEVLAGYATPCLKNKDNRFAID
jgi:hypothetical protein